MNIRIIMKIRVQSTGTVKMRGCKKAILQNCVTTIRYLSGLDVTESNKTSQVIYINDWRVSMGTGCHRIRSLFGGGCCFWCWWWWRWRRWWTSIGILLFCSSHFSKFVFHQHNHSPFLSTSATTAGLRPGIAFIFYLLPNHSSRIPPYLLNDSAQHSVSFSQSRHFQTCSQYLNNETMVLKFDPTDERTYRQQLPCYHTASTPNRFNITKLPTSLSQSFATFQ